MEPGVPILLALFYLMWICAPVIPATFIYWLFPKDPIKVGGPILGKLTFKAGGAFAAYVIVFGLAYPIVDKSLDALGSLLNPSWTVTAKVQLHDVSGNVVNNPQWLDGLTVKLQPDYYSHAAERIIISIPELKTGLPNILLSVPKFGSNAIEWESIKFEKDTYRKTIEIKDPVIIQRVEEIGGGLGAVTTP
jgi:hypothetical protein